MRLAAGDRQQVFPTHVGMNRKEAEPRHGSNSVPYARGDEPCLKLKPRT